MLFIWLEPKSLNNIKQNFPDLFFKKNVVKTTFTPQMNEQHPLGKNFNFKNFKCYFGILSKLSNEIGMDVLVPLRMGLFYRRLEVGKI